MNLSAKNQTEMQIGGIHFIPRLSPPVSTQRAPGWLQHLPTQVSNLCYVPIPMQRPRLNHTQDL